MGKPRVFTKFLGLVLAFCVTFLNAQPISAVESGATVWAKSTLVGPHNSGFENTATDAAGNTYAVGYIYGTGQYDFATM